jgi:hypothetical protein
MAVWTFQTVSLRVFDCHQQAIDEHEAHHDAGASGLTVKRCEVVAAFGTILLPSSEYSTFLRFGT